MTFGRCSDHNCQNEWCTPESRGRGLTACPRCFNTWCTCLDWPFPARPAPTPAQLAEARAFLTEMQMGKRPEALEGKSTGDRKPRGLKPPLYLVPFAPIAWMARIFQFGISPGKYSRGNWRQPVAGESPRQKAQEYYRAAIGHVWSEMEHNERAIEAEMAGQPPGVGLALDGGEGGSSGPHLAHALCSLAMAIQGLVDAGLAPADFGQPWVRTEQEVS